MVHYFHRAVEEIWKNGVLPGLPEPVARIRRLGLDSVDDAMPEASLSRVYVLCNGMAFGPTSEAKQQAG